jgi:glycogen synthase
VVDINESEEKADGIKFVEASVPAVAHTIHKALALYEEPELLAHYRTNGMTANFSVNQTAGEYLKLYEQLL